MLEEDYMTVKELFQMADSELILYAYLMIEPPFDDFLQYDVQTKAEGISEIKSLLNRTIKRILEADYVKDMEPSTVFVMSRTDTEFYDLVSVYSCEYKEI